MLGVSTGQDRLVSDAKSAYQAGRFEEAKKVYLKILENDVHHAPSLYGLGLIAYRFGAYETAAGMFQRAVVDGRGAAEYRLALGLALQAIGNLDEALAEYRHVQALEPHNELAPLRLGNVFVLQGKLDDAVAAFRRSISVQSGCIDAHINMGNVLRKQARFAEARQSYDRALALQPDHVEVLWNRSLLELHLGNFSEGWNGYELRRRRKINLVQEFPQPLWQGEPLNGARILLHSEQGLGDTLQFLRYVPMVQQAGGLVVLSVQPGLRRIAAQLSGLHGLIVTGDPIPAINFQYPLMSLPWAFKTTLQSIPDDVPYLSIPGEALSGTERIHWPTTGLRVGLAWKGGSLNEENRFRSLRTEALARLLDLDNIHFYSFQIDGAFEELPDDLRPRVTDLQPFTTDMTDTAAQLSRLDLLITVDTAVAHLAGALAIHTWVLIPFAPDWRWLTSREDSPWYPTLRLFRQPQFGDWQSVVERIRIELSALADRAGRNQVISL